MIVDFKCRACGQEASFLASYGNNPMQGVCSSCGATPGDLIITKATKVEEAARQYCQYWAILRAAGYEVGGGPEVSKWLESRGIPPEGIIGKGDDLPLLARHLGVEMPRLSD